MIFKKIAVIGSGSYGTAIAQCFSKVAHSITILSNVAEVSSSINSINRNMKIFPDIQLGSNIKASLSFTDLYECELIFIATPASSIKNVCNSLKQHNITAPIVLCSKGFDIDTADLLSNIVSEIIPNDIAILAGPSFAAEIIRNLPACVNIASQNIQLAIDIENSFSSQNFKLKHIDDYIGIQAAGPMKNILAVGCGIIYGLRLGASASAQFIVHGLNEIKTLISAFGGNPDTAHDLCGIGDIILTCTSSQSRNFSFGKFLASGGKLEDWTSALSEGAVAAKSIPMLINKTSCDLKLFLNIYKIIYENFSISTECFLF